MANITSAFSECLKKHDSPAIRPRSYDIDRINSFLQESYRIHARIADLITTLRHTRTRYLSTHNSSRASRAQRDAAPPLTERERDTFDAQSKQLLRQLSNALKGLKQAEDIRVQTNDSVALSKRSKGGFGAIGRWAAGGAVTAKSAEEELDEARRNTIAAFREAIIMFLQAKLERASGMQAEMMEARLSREVEKSKSMLSRSHAGQIAYATDEPGTAGSARNSALAAATEQEPAADSDRPSELTAEQMQLFAAENTEMLKHYEDQLDQVRKAERSILEISELHSQLHANLDQQSHHIDQLVQDSYITTENLDKGNKELKRASERKSTAQAVFFATLGFCSFLVAWDLIF